jgi:hypothetical protein
MPQIERPRTSGRNPSSAYPPGANTVHSSRLRWENTSSAALSELSLSSFLIWRGTICFSFYWRKPIRWGFGPSTARASYGHDVMSADLAASARAAGGRLVSVFTLSELYSECEGRSPNQNIQQRSNLTGMVVPCWCGSQITLNSHHKPVASKYPRGQLKTLLCTAIA